MPGIEHITTPNELLQWEINNIFRVGLTQNKH